MIIKECERLAKVNAMMQPMQVREDLPPYGGQRSDTSDQCEAEIGYA